jgi:hypothetical protein
MHGDAVMRRYLFAKSQQRGEHQHGGCENGFQDAHGVSIDLRRL